MASLGILCHVAEPRLGGVFLRLYELAMTDDMRKHSLRLTVIVATPGHYLVWTN